MAPENRIRVRAESRESGLRYEDDLDIFRHDERNRRISDATAARHRAGTNARTSQSKWPHCASDALPDTHLRGISTRIDSEILGDNQTLLGNVFRCGRSRVGHLLGRMR